MAPVPLVALVEDVVMRWADVAPRAWRLGPVVDVVLYADETWLRAALDALLENAVQHTEAYDLIELSARGEADDVVLSVSDGGAGIDPDVLERIFERFARADVSRSRREGGVGLGLSIAAAIARAHGGSCAARNGPDGGAIFELRLRSATPPTPRRHPSRGRPSWRMRRSRPSRSCENRRVTALYRKYRPQTFAEVVGQEAVVRTLTNAVAQGKVRQAYLFAGPRGTGKTSLARILAKAVNCAHGPTPTPDGTCHACVAIANGTSLDVIEMDAASQRGIDDIRDIRDRVVLQPVEGHYKVYILDEAHQLTDAAWNALLKLIEEPPPHLMFVFCTTELQKVLPTVRSRCQTFVFQRPRLPELVRKLRLISDGEEIDVPDAALALIARGGRGAYRDAESTLDQLASATGGAITVQDVLQLLGAVEDEVLFRLVDMVAANETAEALLFLEELSSQGQDLGRLVHRPPRAPAAPAARPAHARGARVDPRHRRGEGAPARAGEPAAAGDGRPPDRPARRRGRRHAPGRRPAAAARARAREGDARILRPVAGGRSHFASTGWRRDERSPRETLVATSATDAPAPKPDR